MSDGQGWYYRDGTLVEGTDETIGSPAWRAGYEIVSRLLRDMSYKRVAETTIAGMWVSTVWLGLDHGFSFLPGDDRRPIIFETMIFDHSGDEPGGEGVADWLGAWDGQCWRYATEAEAIAGHAEVVNMVTLDAELRSIDVSALGHEVGEAATPDERDPAD